MNVTLGQVPTRGGWRAVKLAGFDDGTIIPHCAQTVDFEIQRIGPCPVFDGARTMPRQAPTRYLLSKDLRGSCWLCAREPDFPASRVT